MKKIGIIGSGMVARALGKGFVKYGYSVIMGSRSPVKLHEFMTENPGIEVGSFGEAADFGEILVLAVSGDAAEGVVGSLAPGLDGKTVIDVTNPIDHSRPPVNGVLPFFTSLDESLMERLQKAAPEARFVKAFSCVGNAFMVNPPFSGGRPTMFICGNDETARREVKQILDIFGWETEDLGMAEAARAIEPLCMLWCIPGLRHNQWTHAFKLMKI